MARKIYFDDVEHCYTDDLNNTYLSTTTLIGKYKHKFDTKGEARRLARQGTGFYKNKSAKQIEQMWDVSKNMACEKGSITHDELENGVKETSIFKDAVKTFRNYEPGNEKRLYTLDDVLSSNALKPVDPKLFYEKVGHKYPIIQQTVEYYCNEGYILLAELGIYDENKLISGMIDLIAINGNDFVIIDWKTNKDDITFESGYYKRDNEGQSTNVYVKKHNDYLKYPIDHMPHCKGSEYGLQLSIYAYMCEQRGLKCGGLVIFHIKDHFVLNRYGQPLRDKNNNYITDTSKGKDVKFIVMPYYKNEVERLFEHHAKTALKNGVQLTMGIKA